MTLLLAATCLSLAYGCYLAWRGHGGPLDPSDPVGDWDDVQASLAVTDLAGAECALAHARRERDRARARYRRWERGQRPPGVRLADCERVIAAVRDSRTMVAHWTAIRDEYRRAL